MKPTYAVLLVIASMTLILLISSSLSVLGYDIGNEPIASTLSILGLTQRNMVMGINLSDYDKNYDNFIRISTENNEQQSNDDICTKLFEDCKVPPKETNATSEPNNDNSREFSKKYLEQDDVNIIENRTAATAPITSNNVSTSSPEIRPDNVTQTRQRQKLAQEIFKFTKIQDLELGCFIQPDGRKEKI